MIVVSTVFDFWIGWILDFCRKVTLELIDGPIRMDISMKTKNILKDLFLELVWRWTDRKIEGEI